MAVYTFKRFNNPETERVKLTQAVTGGAGATNNTDYNSIVGLGRKDVGAIIKVTAAGVGSVVSAKSSVTLTGTDRYYVLAEVPDSAASDDFSFVGFFIKSQYDLDNLIADVARNHSYAKQYYNLRNTGVK